MWVSQTGPITWGGMVTRTALVSSLKIRWEGLGTTNTLRAFPVGSGSAMIWQPVLVNFGDWNQGESESNWKRGLFAPSEFWRRTQGFPKSVTAPWNSSAFQRWLNLKVSSQLTYRSEGIIGTEDREFYDKTRDFCKLLFRLVLWNVFFISHMI